MAEHTLYDILEVSQTASNEAIRSAYQRLCALYDTASAHRLAVPDADIRNTAVRDAFFILASRERRADYDRKLKARMFVPVRRPLFTLPKLVLIGVLTMSGVGGYNVYADKQDQARVAQETAWAAERAAREQVAMVEERARIERARKHARAVAERQKGEKDTSRVRFQREIPAATTGNRPVNDSQRADLEGASAQRSGREAQAAAAARARVAYDRAELCRLERDGIGRPGSC